MNVELHEGDCLEVLATLPDARRRLDWAVHEPTLFELAGVRLK